MNKNTLCHAAEQLGTPLYVFDTEAFALRCRTVHSAFGSKVGLCFSIKANPFLTNSEPDCISHLEVCSPGELAVCEKLGVNPKKIIYSGVNKGAKDVEKALALGAGILTVESTKHLSLIECTAAKLGVKARVIVRLAASTQFGMDENTVKQIIRKRNDFSHIDFFGLHFFTGTMKKKSSLIEKELDYICTFADTLRTEFDFDTRHLEYGTGLAADYFGSENEQTDLNLLNEVAPFIRAAAERYPLTVEMGRFFAAPCGTYLTTVADVKTNSDINFAICDGGIHQLHYDGQLQGMQIPPLEVIATANEDEKVWTLCGSLCTTADVLARKVTLTGVDEDSIIAFYRCGAYSVNEGISTLLSRELPAVAIGTDKDGVSRVRPIIQIYGLNTPATDCNEKEMKL